VAPNSSYWVTAPASLEGGPPLRHVRSNGETHFRSFFFVTPRRVNRAQDSSRILIAHRDLPFPYTRARNSSSKWACEPDRLAMSPEVFLASASISSSSGPFALHTYDVLRRATSRASSSQDAIQHCGPSLTWARRTLPAVASRDWREAIRRGDPRPHFHRTCALSTRRPGNQGGGGDLLAPRSYGLHLRPQRKRRLPAIAPSRSKFSVVAWRRPEGRIPIRHQAPARGL